MDPATHCVEWDVDVGSTPYCPCWDCHLDDLLELPFSLDVPCPIEDHPNNLDTMIVACNKAYSVILRLESIAATRPEFFNLSIIPKIIKRELLRSSIAIYDCEFENYRGPVKCSCEHLHVARQALKRLHDTCVVAGYSIEFIWSFMVNPPVPNHSIFY